MSTDNSLRVRLRVNWKHLPRLLEGRLLSDLVASDQTLVEWEGGWAPCYVPTSLLDYVGAGEPQTAQEILERVAANLDRQADLFEGDPVLLRCVVRAILEEIKGI